MKRLLLVCAVLCSFPTFGWSQEGRFVSVTFLDVGQADAVVIRAPEGQTALVDAGRSAPLEFLCRMGVQQLDLLVATHPHADHIGGVAALLEAVPTRFYMDNGQPHTTATYAGTIHALERHTEVVYLAAEPRRIALGSVDLEVLPLPPLDVDHNDRSVGLVVRFGAFSAFLSGDSEQRELDFFVRHGAAPDVTLLKAPHHGSDNGVTSEFLQATAPNVVVISVGGRNSYGHPGPYAMTAFESVADTVLRTDRHGHVTVQGNTDGSYRVVTGEAALRATGKDRVGVGCR
jgi:beta-lactamase superfamily II metal-dependent hydrolase